MKERNLFEGVSKERLEKALSILYSTPKVEVKVKLKNEKEQGIPAPKEKNSL